MMSSILVARVCVLSSVAEKALERELRKMQPLEPSSRVVKSAEHQNSTPVGTRTLVYALATYYNHVEFLSLMFPPKPFDCSGGLAAFRFFSTDVYVCVCVCVC